MDDAQGDQKYQRREASLLTNQQFEAIDTNQDGELEVDELLGSREGVRPSGTVARRFHLKKRIGIDDGIDNRLLSTTIGGAVGVSIGLGALLVNGILNRNQPLDQYLGKLFVERDTARAAGAAIVRSAKLGALGGAAAGAMCPLGRYWADIGLDGKPYMGTTSTLTKPAQPRPFIFAPSQVAQPMKLVGRFVTGKWGSKPGTIAADTGHFPFGTKFFIP
eukprot:gene13483-15934_t